MTEHTDITTYREPEELNGVWLIAELGLDGTPTGAEFGYATEAQARAAYADLTRLKVEE